MAECEQELRVDSLEPDGAAPLLTCDIPQGAAHAGLNHHDPVYGLWWQVCDLPEHVMGRTSAMADVLTPRCPLCCSLPVMVLGGGTQAFCGNDDCTLICWNPALSVDDNLMDSKVIHLPPMTDDKQPPDSE